MAGALRASWRSMGSPVARGVPQRPSGTFQAPVEAVEQARPDRPRLRRKGDGRSRPQVLRL
jgi:hypothetical protein